MAIRIHAGRNRTAAPTNLVGAAIEFLIVLSDSYIIYLQYFLKRSLTRPQCSPAMKLSMYLPRPGPSLW